MSVIGFDPATVTGWALKLDHDGRWLTGTVDMRNSIDVGVMAGMLWECKPDAAYIEDCYFQKNVKTLKKLQEIQTRIMLKCEFYDIPVTLIMPKVWHAAWGLAAGNPKRDEIEKATRPIAERIAGRKLVTQHECDAVCIAEYGNSIERQGGLMDRVRGGT